MPWRNCEKCGGAGSTGFLASWFGLLPIPRSWIYTRCETCGGDGKMRPPKESPLDTERRRAMLGMLRYPRDGR